VPDEREHRFRQLYAEHYQPVQAYVVRRLAVSADVPDVVAEVFTIAWRRLDDVPAAPADRLWLYGVARRVIGGRHRGMRRLAGLLARLASQVEQSPIEQAQPLQQADWLLAAMQQLRPADREALRLVHWEQLSHAEAGAVLGCSANAVAIRVHRAKARLRELLGSDDGAGERLPGPARPFVDLRGSS
jgi:RNA polymerase sigma factor (sigma-70 family)